MENIYQQYQHLTEEEKQSVKDLIAELQSYFGEEGLAVTQQTLHTWNVAKNDFSDCQYFIISTYYYYFLGATKLFQTAYNEARDAMFTAYSNATQFPDLQGLEVETDAFCSYLTGLLEIQSGNLKKGLDNLTMAQNNLKSQNIYAKYQSFIESIEPDFYFISAVTSLQSLDYTMAKTYSNQAAEKAFYFGKTYGEPNSFTAFHFEGLGNYYRSYIDYYMGERDCSAFYFNSYILKNNIATKGFEKAVACFEQSTQLHRFTVGENLLNLSKTLLAFAQVQCKLAALMHQKLLGQTIDFNFDELKAQLYEIQPFIDKISLQQVVYIQLKNLLEQRIEQMEKWSS